MQAKMCVSLFGAPKINMQIIGNLVVEIDKNGRYWLQDGHGRYSVAVLFVPHVQGGAINI